jgi:hypothetical protein
VIVVAIRALSRSTRASERALRRSVLSTARSAANTAAAMGDLRGALVDFADLGDTVVVVDIPPLYQLLLQRQALCAIYFTRAECGPGRRPVSAWPGPGSLLSTFSSRVNVDSNWITGNATCHMAWALPRGAPWKASNPVWILDHPSIIATVIAAAARKIK